MHTPGPLRWNGPSKEGAYHIRSQADGRRVGLAYTPDDAALWSHAPAMRDSLEELVNMFEGLARSVLRDKYTQSTEEAKARALLHTLDTP